MTDRFELEFEGREYTVQRRRTLAASAAKGGGAPVGRPRLVHQLWVPRPSRVWMADLRGERRGAAGDGFGQWLAAHPGRCRTARDIAAGLGGEGGRRLSRAAWRTRSGCGSDGWLGAPGLPGERAAVAERRTGVPAAPHQLVEHLVADDHLVRRSSPRRERSCVPDPSAPRSRRSSRESSHPARSSTRRGRSCR